MESNDMHEQGFATGTNQGGQEGIRSVSNNDNTEVDAGLAAKDLARDGFTNNMTLGHTHGAVITYDDQQNATSVGSMAASTQPGGDVSKAAPGVSIVLGYDVQKQPGKILQSDIDKATNNPNQQIPLSNPGSFNKTISFYNSNGTIKTINLSSFEKAMSNIK
jgi:hypothetical protein